MQRRLGPVILFAIILAVVAQVGYFYFPDRSAGEPKRVLLDNAGGPVVLQHADHAHRLKIPCMRCHHESPVRRDNVRRCSACHGVKLDDAFRKRHVETFKGDNASCAACHHYELSAKDWGHEAHAEFLDMNCADCHHKDKDIEPEPQNCADCHEAGAPTGKKPEAGTPPNLADAVHARCITCHEGLFKAEETGCGQCHTQRSTHHLAPAKGEIQLHPTFARCGTCHAKPADKLVPGRMDAAHKLCMGCHETLKRGPFRKDQCAQCHTGK